MNAERSSSRSMKCGLVLAAVKAWPGSASAAAPAARRPALTASRHEATANHGSGRRNGLCGQQRNRPLLPVSLFDRSRFFVPTCQCNHAARECPEPEVRTPVPRVRLRTSGSKGHSNHKVASVPLIPLVRLECAVSACERAESGHWPPSMLAVAQAALYAPRSPGHALTAASTASSWLQSGFDATFSMAEGRNAFRSRTTHRSARSPLRPIRQIRAARRAVDGRTPSP